MLIRTISILLISFSATILRGQPCTKIGQTPVTAFPVCGTSIFTQSTVPNCVNNTVFANCPSDVITYQDLNPYWYKFTCFKSGNLAFNIKPQNLLDDYDWQLFDITGLDPNSVYNLNPVVAKAIFVACNWSGVPGNTGTSTSATSLVQCASTGYPIGTIPTSPPPFSKPPDLLQGHNYLLMVSHFSGSNQSGYTLSFAGGSASITDTIPPHLRSATVSCDASSVVVKLNKKMKCSSLASDGSDFSLSPSFSSVISAAGYHCDNGFDMDSIVLTLNKSLSPGNYTLSAKNGTDSNTLFDNCGTNIPIGDQISFSVLALQPTPMDSLTNVTCAPAILQLVFKKPIRCNSIAADGSDFIIIGGPSPVTVLSAYSICKANDLTNSIQVKLDRPIVSKGNYQIQLVRGTDGNTIVDECGLSTPAGSSLAFSTNDTVSAKFSSQLLYGCLYDTILFSQPRNNGITQWQWTFDKDGSSTQQSPLFADSVFGVKNIRLVVTNGFCSDTATSVVNLDNGLKADFEIADVVCPKDRVIFKNNSTGNIVSWNWDFGDGTTSSSQVPPDHAYPPITTADQDYKIVLIIQNNLGCRKTITHAIKELHTCYIAVPNAFTPNGDGLNDYLYPLNAYKAVDLEFRVFNRYGQLVFETKDWTRKWDGKIGGVSQPTSTYVWTLQYTDRETGKRFFLKGTSTLIR